MECLIGFVDELFSLCTKQTNIGAIMVWGAFVTIVVWSPCLLPKRVAGVAWHLFGYGMLSIFVERFISIATSPQPYLPLLEITAIGLTAIFVWLESVKRKQEKSEIKAPWLERQHQDWMNAVRLALWATLTLMPTVHWA